MGDVDRRGVQGWLGLSGDEEAWEAYCAEDADRRNAHEHRAFDAGYAAAYRKFSDASVERVSMDQHARVIEAMADTSRENEGLHRRIEELRETDNQDDIYDTRRPQTGWGMPTRLKRDWVPERAWAFFCHGNLATWQPFTAILTRKTTQADIERIEALDE